MSYRDDEVTQFYTVERAKKYLENRGYEVTRRLCLNDWTIDEEEVVCKRYSMHEGHCEGVRESCGTVFKWKYGYDYQ